MEQTNAIKIATLHRICLAKLVNSRAHKKSIQAFHPVNICSQFEYIYFRYIPTISK